MSYLLAYVVSIFGGWAIAAACMWVMRCSVGQKKPFWRPVDLWIGGTERAVATTLVLFDSHHLAAFIGGWVALKFAANWQRFKEPTPEITTGSLLFLIGNAISFAVAIAVGIVIDPGALARIAE